MRSKTKEAVIVLPNRDECPAGKTKDETKLVGLVTAEYDMADDISYFNLHKDKNRYLLKLVFIPGHVDEIQTTNGKKFVMFELIRNGINSVFRVDDDLNKRMVTILSLLNSDDLNAKETIRAKLSDIIDAPGQLDHIVDMLLSDAQFNSFKYTVLNSSKTSCLMCVNSSGISVRAIDPPFEVQDHLGWADISQVTSKNKRVIVTKNDGQSKEICCLNKKAAHAAQRHLRLYLGFMSTDGRLDHQHRPVSPLSASQSPSSPAPAPALSWIGRISQRLRKSFGRHPAAGSGESSRPAPSSGAIDKPTSQVAMERRHQTAAPPSTVPDSSFISEDVMDHPISSSNVEPSLKTNSTYDVSLGSDSSYRPPTITSLSNEELSNNGERTSGRSRLDQQQHSQQQHSQQQHSQQYPQHSQYQSVHQAANDDRVSFKTTSTYEVSLDSRQMVRPMTIEHDSLGSSCGGGGSGGGGGPLSSFSPAPSQPTRTSSVKTDPTGTDASTNGPVGHTEHTAVEHLRPSVTDPVTVSTDNVDITAYQLRYEEPAADRYYTSASRSVIATTHNISGGTVSAPSHAVANTAEPSSTTTVFDNGRVMLVKPVVMTATAKILPEVPVRTVTADTGNSVLANEMPVSTVANDAVVKASTEIPARPVVDTPVTFKVSTEEPLTSIVPDIGDKVPEDVPDMSVTERTVTDSREVSPLRTAADQSMMTSLPATESKPIPGPVVKNVAPEPPIRTESERPPLELPIVAIDSIKAMAEPRQDDRPLDEPPQVLVKIATPSSDAEAELWPPALDTDVATDGATSDETGRVSVQLENGASLTTDVTPPPPQPVTQQAIADKRISQPREEPTRSDRPDVLDLSSVYNNSTESTRQPDSRLPVSKSRSIPSPKVQRPSRVPTREVSSPKRDTGLQSSMIVVAQSPSDKENYQNDNDDEEDSTQDSSSISIDKPTTNFSRFEGQEYRVDSKTTITTVSTVGDNVVKRSTQTEIATLKSTGIPTPKQYKSTTTIISTVKKPADVSKSPSNSATKIPTGIPRMSSK